MRNKYAYLLEYKQAKKAIKNNVEDIDKNQLKNMNNT